MAENVLAYEVESFDGQNSVDVYDDVADFRRMKSFCMNVTESMSKISEIALNLKYIFSALKFKVALENCCFAWKNFL